MLEHDVYSDSTNLLDKVSHSLSRQGATATNLIMVIVRLLIKRGASVIICFGAEGTQQLLLCKKIWQQCCIQTNGFHRIRK